VARFPRIPPNHDHFDGAQAFVKDIGRPGACPQGGGGIARLAAKLPVAGPRALGIPGMQASDLHGPLTILLGRGRVCSRNGLLNTMAELLSVTGGEVRIAIGFVQTLGRWRPIRPFGKEPVILHHFTLELSYVWHNRCPCGLKLRSFPVKDNRAESNPDCSGSIATLPRSHTLCAVRQMLFRPAS
jgi:hypothetical protein